MKKTEYIFRNLDTGEVDYCETEIAAPLKPATRTRRPKEKETPESMRASNERIRKRRLRHLLIANFRENDYFLTLTWKKELRPDSLDDGKTEIKRFLRQLRKFYKKAGIQLKYVGVLERGGRGGLHFHCVINRIPDIDCLINEIWQVGHVNIKMTYKEGKFWQLADYIGKDSAERWMTRSRNMSEPEVKSKKLKDNQDVQSMAPVRRKGFDILPDSVISGINPYTGRAYMRYAQVRSKTKVKKTDVYIGVSTKNPRKAQRKWSYILEYKEKTRQGAGKCDDTYHGAILKALATSLNRFSEKCEIHIHCDDEWIVNQIRSNLPAWAKNGFVKADGKPIEHQSDWKKLWMAMDGNVIRLIKGDHKYSGILEKKMEDNDAGV